MGRLFLVEFDSSPGLVHYRCRECFFHKQLQPTECIPHFAFRSNIVLEEFISDEQYITLELHNNSGGRMTIKDYKPGHFFTRVVNVVFGEPVVQDYLKQPGIMADMYCNRCNMHLGCKIIKSLKPSYKFREGLYVLDRTKIDRWIDQDRNGTYPLSLTDICP